MAVCVGKSSGLEPPRDGIARQHAKTKHDRNTCGQRLTRIGLSGGLKQKGIITYGLSANRQNPVAGAAHDAIFNTWRRISKQILYVAPPFIGFYYAMEWATHRYELRSCPTTLDLRRILIFNSNHYLNSKQGRAEFGEEE